jgi:hypothetical protein
MASIRKEILIAASPDKVRDAVRDVGAVHRPLARVQAVFGVAGSWTIAQITAAAIRSMNARV